MYEAAKTHMGSQLVRIPADTVRIDPLPQQVDMKYKSEL